MKWMISVAAVWKRITFPGQVPQQLAWRGYALNNIVLLSILITLPYALRDLYSLCIVFDRFNLDNLLNLLIQVSIFWISKSRRIRLALQMECGYFYADELHADFARRRG